MKVKETKEGCWYKGMFIPAWSGLYYNDTPRHFRGALPGLSRTLKADGHHPACVCVEELIDNDMEKKNVLTPDERKAIIKRVRIRKLTPKTCWRLMGCKDDDFEKAKAAGISDSQLYKLAGNSIVVNVLEGIFTQLFREDNECLF